jgi:orotidine-5'-phosphate decarboxylase
MNAFKKFEEIREKNNSILCVGLDSEIEKLPIKFKRDVASLFDFNRVIIDATKDLVCAYKINFAFYEQYGIEGFEVLKKTFEYIPEDIFTIADAKRGDIGNTSKAYAKSCFEYFGADSITVSPYMGQDSVQPFLDYNDKMVFILALTSNKGSMDFQRLVADEKPIFKHIVDKSMTWANHENIGYVVGATHPNVLKELRDSIPNNCFLIPGIGAQGGSIEDTIKANSNGPAIINVSRSIIFASDALDFELSVREKALYYKQSFNEFM